MASPTKRSRMDSTNNSSINYSRQAFDNNLQLIHFSLETEESDLIRVMNDFRSVLRNSIQTNISKFKGIKISLIITVEYRNMKFSENEPFTMYLRSAMVHIYQESTIDEAIENIYRNLLLRNEHMIRNESGLSIAKVHYMSIQISRFNPLAAAGYKPLPKFLEKKKAIINIRNKDERCFGYAILAGIYKDQKNNNPERPKLYEKLFQINGLAALSYPVQPQDIPAIEEQLNIKINVFSFYDDEGKGRYPLYVSRRETYRMEIDLLYWEEHYALIKKFSAFIYDLSPKHSQKYFCKRCFGVFLTQHTFQRHEELCSRSDFDSVIYRFPPPQTTIKFTQIKFQLKAPFVIYADFECILKPNNENTNRKSNSKAYAEHYVCAAAFFICSSNEQIYPSQYLYHDGINSDEWFLNRINQISTNLMEFLLNNERLIMTEADQNAFNEAKSCWICGIEFDLRFPSTKVRDHDHMTGKYRGAAHSLCNLQLQQNMRIPVFFHNFRGYDSHIITRATELFPQTKINVIGQGYEKYLTLRFGPIIIFKDSFQFMGYSLECLCQELARSGPERFTHLRKAFSDISEEDFKLLLRKGVYPYEFMDSIEKLENSHLPSKENFFNSLKQAEITDSDYEHAQKIWTVFNCTNMRDYMNLYLKTDVLILCDIFENFRLFSLEHYSLDPSHFVSAPQLSWEAMLRFTGCTLELISDPTMFEMMDRGLRGGVSMIVHRYAKANNPEMGQNYNSKEPLSYIVYLDANNLYGYAMSQPLPTGGFRWLQQEEWNLLDWKSLEPTSTKGYILEVDLEYPNELHENHNDYPLAPDKRQMQFETLNEYQIRIMTHYEIPKSSLKMKKLIPHLGPRKHYIIHYRNLRFYLEEGMKLTKIHNVLEFDQSTWLAPYILKNQQLRAIAKSDFEKNQPKLFNNSIYGKTCENQKKRTDIRLANNQALCKKLIDKPHMIGFRIFSQNLAAIDLRKIYAKIDKPFYVGFSVLELSKLHMYNFHYRYIKRKFGDSAQLLFTDTDSLMYLFNGRNPYEEFYQDRQEYFDFASFPHNHKLFDPENNKVIGKFKDEANGDQITEFVGLRPKMYSFLTNNNSHPEKHTAKGIQYVIAKKLKHEDYLKQLNNPTENKQINRRIGSKLHKIYSFSTLKRGLCSFDDKRLLLEDGISTLAYGHYRATAEQVEVGMPENEQQIFIDHSENEGQSENEREEEEHEGADEELPEFL